MSSGTDSKVALISGAAMGIGAAIAEQLARDGFAVLVSDINFEEADKTARAFRDSLVGATLATRRWAAGIGRRGVRRSSKDLRPLRRDGEQCGHRQDLPVHRISARQLARNDEHQRYRDAALQSARCAVDGTETLGPDHQHRLRCRHACGRPRPDRLRYL